MVGRPAIRFFQALPKMLKMMYIELLRGALRYEYNVANET